MIEINNFAYSIVKTTNHQKNNFVNFGFYLTNGKEARDLDPMTRSIIVKEIDRCLK